MSDMLLDVYTNDDYAGLDAGSKSFYYGYEELINEDTDEEEWCFVYREDDEEKVRYSTSKIDEGFGDLNSPSEYLLAGIAMVLAGEQLTA